MQDLIVTRLGDAKTLLAQAKDAISAKKVVDLAHAAEIYGRRQKLSDEAIAYAHEIKIDALRLMGEYLSKAPKAKGGGDGSNQHKRATSTKTEPVAEASRGAIVEPRDNTPTYAEAGIDKKQAATAQFLAVIAQSAPEVYEAVKTGQSTIADVKKQVKKAETKKRNADIASRPIAAATSDKYQLIQSGVSDLLAHLPAGSIDAIITDPPYPAEFLPVYAELARASAKLLKPGAPLVVMIGHSHLPEICALMTPHIKYLWTVAYITPANTARVFSAHALVNWKPVLVFSNGTYAGDWYADVVNNAAPDKRFHEWGQGESGMAALIERFSAPGQTVLDPFCGGSATGAAALKLDRRYIGADLDPAAIAISAQRLAELKGA